MPLPMSTLPATYSQAVALEALAYAKAEWEKYVTQATPWSTPTLLSPETGRRFVFNFLVPVCMQTYDGRCVLIGLAKAGYREAAEALKKIALEIQSRNEELPVELKAYELEVRRRGHDYWAPPPGPKWINQLGRNLAIALTVAAVLDHFGIQATQSSPREVSACRVVAEVIHLSYDAVVKVWKQFQGAAPTVPGWSFR